MLISSALGETLIRRKYPNPSEGMISKQPSINKKPAFSTCSFTKDTINSYVASVAYFVILYSLANAYISFNVKSSKLEIVISDTVSPHLFCLVYNSDSFYEGTSQMIY